MITIRYYEVRIYYKPDRKVIIIHIQILISAILSIMWLAISCIRSPEVYRTFLMTIFTMLMLVALVPIRFSRLGILTVRLFAWLWLALGLIMMGSTAYSITKEWIIGSQIAYFPLIIYLYYIIIALIIFIIPAVLLLYLVKQRLKLAGRKEREYSGL